MSDALKNSAPGRFEFRIFGRDLKNLKQRLKELTGPVPEHVIKRSSREIYLLSLTNDTCNCKIRDHKIDIKSIVAKKDKLEQWDVVLKSEFPLDRRTIVKEVFPAMWTRAPLLEPGVYALDDFLAVTRRHKDIRVVMVEKVRFGFNVHGVICEFAKVFVNGARIHTVAVESEDTARLIEVANLLEIYNFENLNYPAAIRRVLGLDGMQTIQ